MSNHNPLVHARWWLSLPVTLLCLVVVDLALLFWQPTPERLPPQFSSRYLARYISAIHGSPKVVFLGDSVLWGYRVDPNNAASSILAHRLPHVRVMNLSYEGGSSVNSYFMLRYLLRSGIRPSLVIFNVNSKESNPLDKSYRRLNPALERLVRPMLGAADRKQIALSAPADYQAKLQLAFENVWALYAYRSDLREFIFGADDAATALRDALSRITGSAKRQAEAHRPTPERFLGTYDLSPLTDKNVEYIYLKELGALLSRERIAGIAILTPTNHRLLSEYIDSPGYSAKLRQLTRPLAADGIPVLDYDTVMRPDEFLDNDHLTPAGNQHLEQLLEPEVRRVLQR